MVVHWNAKVPGEEEAVRQLIPIARQVAAAYAKRSGGRRPASESYSDALLGVLEAVRTFDPAKGDKLEHYARMLAARRVIDGVRADSPVSRRLLKAGYKAPEHLGEYAEMLASRYQDEREVEDEFHDELVALVTLCEGALRRIKERALRESEYRQLMLFMDKEGPDETTQEGEEAIGSDAGRAV